MTKDTVPREYLQEPSLMAKALESWIDRAIVSPLSLREKF